MTTQRRASSTIGEGSRDQNGLGVDRFGGPAFDPSRNVLDLVQAAILRQDDLRDAERRLAQEQISHVEAMAAQQATNLRAISQAETNRIDILRNVQLQHVEQVAALRAEHTKELLVAEAGRINAIREVDVSGVSTATERATQQAVVLANQVAASAETLRALVASTNGQIAASLNQMTTQFAERLGQVEKSASDRISLLEKSSYEGKGKEAVSDPMLGQMVSEMKSLRQDMTLSAGKGAGIEKAWGWIVAAAGSGGVLAYLASHFSN